MPVIRLCAPMLASVVSATLFAGLMVVVFAIPHDAPQAGWLIALLSVGIIMIYAEVASGAARALARGGAAPGFGEYLVCGCAAAACGAFAPIWAMLLVLTLGPMILPRHSAPARA